jgi:c-type cytochrome biogenesis protein CcmF
MRPGLRDLQSKSLGHAARVPGTCFVRSADLQRTVMPGLDLPFFGSLVLAAVLVVAAYTLALGLMAGRGRPELLPAVRYGVYASWALVAVAVFTLGYAFQAHDFRIRYVLRYSDRSMPWYYLWASLWGGQDGSLLWWSFLLVTYSAVCARSLKHRLTELAPYIMATLMSILIFFCVLMLFAANPFAVVASGAAPDGEGLNPLLQNYWMMIHPPTLYTGMVGWSVPFAFVVAALVTGRLNNEWIVASRRFTLFAWLALAVGNVLGMLWSYEELGWGGYWAWDPVENAAFMPLLAGTPFLHSVMLQERRGMFKVWNVFLICLTFFMTIFGTFLTRSGMIASVHSFARSSIGIYFVWYMVFLVVACGALIVWRLPLLRSQARIDSLLSRDFVFLLNNWILMGMLFFVLIATTFPLISEALRGETVTVGPGYYNKWMVPLGLVLMSLTGVGPLLAWRKSTRADLWRVLVVPGAVALVMLALHTLVGPHIGFPAFVKSDEIYDTVTGRVLAFVYLFVRGCGPFAGVLARNAVAHAQYRRRPLHRADRARDARQAALWRISRAHGFGRHVLRLHRFGLRHRERGRAAPGPELGSARLHDSLRRQSHGSRSEPAHGVLGHDRLAQRQARGRHRTGQIHLYEATGYGHDRSRDSLDLERRHLRDHEYREPADQGRHVPHHRAAVRGLDLARWFVHDLRHVGVYLAVDPRGAR